MALRWAAYFYTASHNGARPSLRQRLFALYDPFARRCDFAAGIRYCCNVYTGCAHGCAYCYCRNYIRRFDTPRTKTDFLQRAKKDLADICNLDLPPVPVHVSNSTDPFQPALERRYRHTLALLELIAAHRVRFTTLTLLTKNPQLAAEAEYTTLLRQLAPCRVEVSLCFADDTSRQLYEPTAPSVSIRMEGIARLCQEGIPTAIRIDPLFPRQPLPPPWWPQERLSAYGIDRTQRWEELETLVDFAVRVGCDRIVVSPLKVPIGRATPHPLAEQFRALFAAPFDGRPRIKGYALRLPDEYVHTHLVGPVVRLCRLRGIACLLCKTNLVTTR